VAQDIKMGISIAPAPSSSATSDYDELRDILADCELAYRLGYNSIWTQEHHATSYHQVPGTLLFLSYVARSCPEFDLGTACIILPWHNPVRLAGELTMLAGLTRGDLQIGCGRGTSRHEYYTMGVDMSQARERFDETLDILRLALTGKPFTYTGQFHSYPREICIHPNPQQKRINLYGAVGSVPSAKLMAERAVPPLFTSAFPNRMLGEMVSGWKSHMQASDKSIDVDFNIQGQLLIADTDEEAYALGREYYPLFFKMMVEHYEVEKSASVGVQGYEDFEKVFASYRRWGTEPGAIDQWLGRQFVGSAETVSRRMQELIDLGFNSFGFTPHVYGVPNDIRRDCMRRFAEDVAPNFSPSFRPRTVN
jgi:alkanesulfonate monooxygenase SsuD/methylene tetrahydromethanopterin reductase-like flavin-dependent oxidoreductase (luciferase family)